ncbi:MAG: ABC transporter substrate-binding protein [Candidatus Thermoplasmatota archaeon]|jgi:trehalose transport system substrate-binding protein|nr:ABC transporter substrate-binding protein [Candidatus Thermoplasmatota archaeon]MCL5786200.1 ABC transporter substrate-binding protein [Candidatus Thermoplasmatota archaeon]
MNNASEVAPTGEKKAKLKYAIIGIIVVILIVAGTGVYFVLSSSPHAKQTLTVNISLSGSELKFYQNTILPEFEKAYPNLTLQFTTESATSVVSTLQSEGTSPTIDVVQQDNGFTGPLVASGLVMPLNPYLSQFEPITGNTSSVPSSYGSIIPAYYHEGMFGSTYYFFPIRGNVQLAYYNQSALTAVGTLKHLVLPQPTNTTNLMIDMEALNSSGYAQPFNMQGHQGASTPTQVFQWMAEFNGNPMAFNTTGDIKALTFLQNMENKGLMSPHYSTGYWGSYKGLASNSYQYIDQWPYITTTMSGLGWNNTTQSSTHNLGINQVFAGPNNDSQFIVGGDVLGIVNHTSNLWAATHYIQFLDSASVQTQLLQNLTWPVVNTAAYNSSAASGLPFKMIQLEEAHGIFRPAVPWMTQWDNYFDSAWAVIMAGGNVTTALNTAHANMYNYLEIYYSSTSYPSEYAAGAIYPTGDYTGPT